MPARHNNGKLQATDSALGACENREPADAEQELQSCAQQLRKKFVLVVISWSTNDDVDLHVIDPAGREYYYEKKFHSGSRAKLEEDRHPRPGQRDLAAPGRGIRAATGCTSSTTAAPAGMCGYAARC